MSNLLRNWLQKWLKIESNESRIETLETLLFHQPSRMNGFAVLKRHLNRPDRPLPNFRGKVIEQD